MNSLGNVNAIVYRKLRRLLGLDADLWIAGDVKGSLFYIRTNRVFLAVNYTDGVAPLTLVLLVLLL